MKAIALTRYLPIDDPNSLMDVPLEEPEPTGRDLLVATKAIAVNPVDYKVRAPKDKVEPSPKVLGWDAAGVVQAVGPDVSLFKPGDEVFYAGDITRQGTNSEFHLIDQRIVGTKPKSLDFAGAAAFPLTSITAYEAFFDRLGIDIDGHWHAATDLIRPQGHIVTIVENREPLDQSEMKMKAATFSWEFMFARSMYQTPDMIEQHHLLNRVASWIDEGRIQATANNVVSPINAVNLRKAHAHLESGRAIGKIVLKDWE